MQESFDRLAGEVKRQDIPDKFGEIATEAYLFNKHGFGVEHINAACRAYAAK